MEFMTALFQPKGDAMMTYELKWLPWSIQAKGILKQTMFNNNLLNTDNQALSNFVYLSEGTQTLFLWLSVAHYGEPLHHSDDSRR